MERMIEISKDDYDALVMDRVRALDFVRTVVEAMDDDGFVAFDSGTVLAALRAIYPEEYRAKMQSRHTVRTPFVEIRTEGGDDI